MRLFLVLFISPDRLTRNLFQFYPFMYFYVSSLQSKLYFMFEVVERE